ncbi:MAG TPA: serine hydrolase [Gemmatimonadales bacterium]|nr:serine hydrolase [Gemmatimonadales bacterium]
MRAPIITPLVAAILAALPPAALAQTPLPPDSAVRAILADRLPGQHGGGFVVGLLDADGTRRVVNVGAPADGVFEIGSITKVFTATILADMVSRGQVRLDDPVAQLLPATVKVPSRDGRRITLLDLATQSSGLPRLPTNFAPKDSANPYADYGDQQLYDFLSGYELPRDPGATYEYSNLGMGLLGHALARKAGMSYEQLVTRRVLAPLGMKETAITLSRALRARLVPGHGDTGQVVANWELTALAGAGALRSTVRDMLTFLAANLDSSRGPLARPLHETHVSRRAAGSPNMTIGLAWHILAPPGGGSIVWHNGGTGGYRSFIGFDPVRRVGVVLLTNSVVGADDIGFHLLDASLPLRPPPKPRTEVAVDSTVLGRYVGEYELVPAFHIVVTQEGKALFIQATGQSRVPIFAESQTDFFLKVVDAQISFVRDSTGAVTGLVLHQNGRDTPGRRLP